jgi:[ribosomal protein S5]-alanine N-acetyltransferase
LQGKNWHGFTMNIKTARLAIRHLTTEDRTKLFEIYSDKEAMKYRGSKPFEQIDDVDAMLQETVLKMAANEAYRYAVNTIEGDELIGTFLIKVLPDNSCEIGYSLGKQYWGLGYAKELLAAMLEYAATQNYTTIIATSKKENVASTGLLEKVGFVKVPEKATDVLYHFQYEGNQ